MRSSNRAAGQGARIGGCVCLILLLLVVSGCRWEDYIHIQSIDQAGEGRLATANMTAEEKAAYRRELIRKRHIPPARQIETHYRCGVPEEAAKSLKGTALSGLDIDTLLARLIRVMKAGTPKTALKFESTPGVMYAWTFHYTLRDKQGHGLLIPNPNPSAFEGKVSDAREVVKIDLYKEGSKTAVQYAIVTNRTGCNRIVKATVAQRIREAAAL